MSHGVRRSATARRARPLSRRMPLGAGSVFRIVVVRYRGGFMEQLPWVDDGRLTEDGNQVNPTLVEDGDGVALVYDVQDPGFRTDHGGPRGWVTRTVRLNLGAG